MSEQDQSSPLPHKTIGVAVIWNEQGQILIDKRQESGLMAGLWEFPGGKIEERETITECIKREIKEELDLEIEVKEHLITINHVYPEFSLTLVVHQCRYLEGEPKPLECSEIRWVSVAELEQFIFPAANIKIIETLKFCV
jgi:A/G-specific adenine glycosylase